ncbi:potassium voltage-gated channel subfamily C member 1-like [Podarcis raffonei]|uniref:potassium voltage-gated channel subfamily C member 1-like n=1 Tax=Podarcis raffonei TaxID=65483 RepID=UPI0023293896|nr:potassium voltage-gated channel subfamily C member 1-like [Podarcis raffonei]XP_053230221.1 potassium voltage-gated channel subfamily C member 1-like [Podarcis raffonei]
MEVSAGKVILNVGGMRYETYLSTLQAFPGTKLWSLTEPQANTKHDHDPSTQEFFFDRSGRLFGQVLNYYSTKQLHCPAGVCESAFEEELDFWGLTGTQLAPCCWRGPQEEVHDIGIVDEQDNDQGLLIQEERRSGCQYARWRAKLWDLFEKPHSSKRAMGLAVVSLLFTIAIIIILCEESKGFIKSITPEHTIESHHHHYYHHFFPSAYSYEVAPYLLHLELFFILCFTAEFFIRIMCCPDLKKFLKNPLNIADLLSLFPVYIELSLARPSQEPHPQESHPLVQWLGLCRIIYIIKLLKVLRLVETPLMLRVLPCMFKSILREILIFLLIFASEVFFFGTLCFYGELLSTNFKIGFGDIGEAFWWAVITLTTVGYGELVPVSVTGQAIAACTALCGVLTIVVPVPIFLFSFKGCYDAAVIKERRKRKAMEAVTLLS